MQITSGYRSPSHSKEASKATPGEHTMGLAADVYAVSSGDRFRLLKVLFDLHIPRIGIAKNFIHIGTSKDLPQGVVWVY
jgi:uncharacterized protein YcbK (DUF882 family)